MALKSSHQHRRVASSEAVAAASAASSTDSTRHNSLARSRSVPRHFHNFGGRTSSMVSRPGVRFSPERKDSYTRTFSTSVMSVKDRRQSSIDDNLSFDDFDGGVDDIYYTHTRGRPLSKSRSQEVQMVKRYIPGPQGLKVVETPVLRPQSPPAARRARSHPGMVESHPQTPTKLHRAPHPSLSSPPQHENKEKITSPIKKQSTVGSPLRRSGAVRRKSTLPLENDAIKVETGSPSGKTTNVHANNSILPRNYRTTYQDGENTYEKTVVTKPTKDHGCVETTTIVRRHTRRETPKTEDLHNKPNNDSSESHAMALRKEVKRSKDEQLQLEKKLKNIKSAERTLAEERHLQHEKSVVSMRNQRKTNPAHSEISSAPVTIQKPKTATITPDPEPRDNIAQEEQSSVEDPQNKLATEDAEEQTSDNGDDVHDDTSIVSSLVKYDHLSTIESVDIDPSTKASPKRQNILPRDTSNKDIKLINTKLNAFLEKEMIEEDREKDNFMLSRDSLLFGSGPNIPIQGASSNFNSNISLNLNGLNDSQISVVPSLDLGMSKENSISHIGEADEDRGNVTVPRSQPQAPPEIPPMSSRRIRPSMAQYIKASRPYLANSDNEDPETPAYDNTPIEHDTYLDINHMIGSRSESVDNSSHVNSTFTMNIPHSNIPSSSYTSVESHSKIDAIQSPTLVAPPIPPRMPEYTHTYNYPPVTPVAKPVILNPRNYIDNSFKSETSSVYSSHTNNNSQVNRQRVIGLGNLEETVSNFGDADGQHITEDLVVGKTREDYPIMGHRATQSVDVSQLYHPAQYTEQVEQPVQKVRSKSLSRRISFSSAVKTINRLESGAFKKHERNSSLGKNFKKMFSFHS